MPPSSNRVAETFGTPVSPPVSVSLDSTEILLIVFAIGVMLLLATIFLLGVWFFINRLKREQDRVVRLEERSPQEPGTGSKPDAVPAGRGFTPQAELNPRDD